MSSPVASPAEKSDLPKRKRQFRLRTILLLTTVAAICLGGWLHIARQQRDRQQREAELRKVGADIYYDFHSRGYSVDFRSSAQVTDADLAHLKGLTSLKFLWLNNTPVTDAGLVHLKGLTSLEHLSLSNTQVTDAGLEHLKGLTSLRVLFLDNTQVTDAGLVHLKGTSLQYLSFKNTQVTYAGWARLQESLPESWGESVYE